MLLLPDLWWYIKFNCACYLKGLLQRELSHINVIFVSTQGYPDIENHPFFERIEIMAFDIHQQFSAIISPRKYMQHHSGEGCLFSSEKICGVECYKLIESSSSEKLFSENRNWFCLSNLEEQRKSYKNP